MGFCNMTAKCVLIVLGVFFWLSAGALTYVSVKVFQTYENYEDITKSYYTLIPAGIILGAAVFLFITGLLGFCGACKENKCLLGTFFMLILLVLLLQISGAILGYVYRDEIKDGIRVGMDTAIHNYTDDKYTDSVDTMQSELKCCGIDNYTDWTDTAYYHKNNTVPTSCCRKNETQCTGSLRTDEDIRKLYQEGCYVKVSDIFRDNLKYFVIAGSVLALILIIGLVFSCVLMCSRKEVPYESLRDEYRV